MDVRQMCRQYLEARPDKRSGLLPNTTQKHCRRSLAGTITEWCVDFEKCLSRLDQREVSLLLLVYGAGFNPQEAARLLQMHPRSVRMRLGIAEEKLRDAIEEIWLSGPLPCHRQVVPNIRGVATEAACEG